MKRSVETDCAHCGLANQWGCGKENCAGCGGPTPSRPNPFILSDPFWGSPPYTSAYITLGAFAVAFIVGWAIFVIALANR